ncbi:MAG TPA: flagellar basal body P-ring formation protein FlgA [Rhodospirillaceae bacterium]|nr:flagellar basal body P-ring formation protein FlgA [Rhodospirillaceae bacterium]
MKRLILASLLLLVARPCLAEALLRPDVVIDGDVVKLGDLFDGIGVKADIAIARAPLPGKRVTVDAAWLARMANTYQLAWRPQNAYEQAVIERSGIEISDDLVRSRILEALGRHGVPDSAEIDWSNHGTALVVPVGAAGQFAVRDVTYDDHYGRFTATLEAANTRLHVAGRAFKTVEVPVLAHPVNRGDVIDAHALTWSRVREVSVRRDFLTNAEAIVGMVAHQPLKSGQMVSMNDVEKQLAVAKGAMVTLVLKVGSMSLTSQGRAVEQGSVGDTIRITNTRSNMTVEGKIEGLNLVSVPLNGTALAN